MYASSYHPEYCDRHREKPLALREPQGQQRCRYTANSAGAEAEIGNWCCRAMEVGTRPRMASPRACRAILASQLLAR